LISLKNMAFSEQKRRLRRPIPTLQPVFLAENAKSRVKSGVFGRRGDRKLPKSIPRSRAARIGLYRHESASIGLTLRYRSLLPFIRDSYEELIPLGLLPQPWRNVFPPRQRDWSAREPGNPKQGAGKRTPRCEERGRPRAGVQPPKGPGLSGCCRSWLYGLGGMLWMP